jgi:hypothetical protein
MKHLAQSQCPLLIEGPIDGVRAVRTSSERLFEALLIDMWMALRAVCGLQPRLTLNRHDLKAFLECFESFPDFDAQLPE